MIRFCSTSAQLQAALDAAVAGDIIRLDHTKTFFGWFVVRNRGIIPDNNRIIIEGDADPTLLPQPGYRIKPSFKDLLPKLQQDYAQFTRQNEPTILFEPQSNGYIVRFLEVLPQYHGSGEQISVGRADNTQTEYYQQPYNITIDRCYIHGHPFIGQKRGIGIHGKNIKILNNYIEDITALGQDCMCIGGMVNGEGPVDIINNYLEGATYSFITAGQDPTIKTVATVLAAPAPTTNSATVSTIKDLVIGQYIAILFTDGSIGKQRRAHPKITAINAATNRITYDDIGFIPDVPGDIRWGVQIRHITFRRNYLTKKLAWKDSMLLNPVLSAPTITPIGTGGIAAGTYYYKAQAINYGGGYSGNDVFGKVVGEVQAVLSTTSNVTLSWNAITYAGTYRIYRYQKDGSGNAINMRYFETNNLNFTDIGNAGTVTGSIFNPGGDKPTVKNFFELKTGTNVQVDSNVMENHWTDQGGGYCIWLKNNNQDLSHNWTETSDVVFEKNILRHLAAFMSASGSRSSGEVMKDLPDHMRRTTIRNNLVYDSTAFWVEGAFLYANLFANGMYDFTFDHNTVIAAHAGAISMFTKTPDPGYDLNMKITNNILIGGSYGVRAQEGPGFGTSGKSALDAQTNNTETFEKNVIKDLNGVGGYDFAPKVNYYPDDPTFFAQFKNYDLSNGDYRLKRIAEGDSINSLYINAGTDGKDIGCDIPLVLNATAGVIEGIPEGVAPGPPPPEPPPEPPPPPPPPPPVSSNVLSKVVTFPAATVVGDQVIDVGFQPAALLFFYTLHNADGQIPWYGHGLGCATPDGSMWAGYSSAQHNVAIAMANDYQKITACIGAVDGSNNIVREATVKSWNLTGFTLDWTTVDPTAHLISVIALGGGGILNAKAFNHQVLNAVGLQSINVGFDASSLLFYMPVNIASGTIPYVGSKNTCLLLGAAASVGEQAYISNRIKSNVSPSANWRYHKSGACFGVQHDPGMVMEAKLDAFIANGFRLNYTNVSTETNTMFGLALRGPRMKIALIQEPVANGDVTYVSGFKPEVVILAGDLNPNPGNRTTHARFAFGAAASPTGQNTSFCGGYTDAVNPTVGSTTLDRAKLYHGRLEGGAEQSQASLKAYTTDGYTLTWSGTPSGTELLSIVIGQSSAAVIPILLETVVDYEVGVLQPNLVTEINMASKIEYGLDIESSLQALAVNHKSVVSFFDLKINLDIKRELDSGSINVLASDVGGTQVNFHKAFKDIDSITLTVSGVTPVTAIYDFVDIPNPTGFKILAFNPAGARVNAEVSWKARGIV